MLLTFVLVRLLRCRPFACHKRHHGCNVPQAMTSAPTGSTSAPGDSSANADALDAFMSGVATELDDDKVRPQHRS